MSIVLGQCMVGREGTLVARCGDSSGGRVWSGAGGCSGVMGGVLVQGTIGLVLW